MKSPKQPGKHGIAAMPGKPRLPARRCHPLKAMYDKLMGLTFVEPRVAPVAELLDTAFRSIPKRGAITGALLSCYKVCFTPAKSQALMEHGQMILDGRKNSRKILESLLLAECAVQVESERRKEDLREDALFDDAPLLPVIESHGLW